MGSSVKSSYISDVQRTIFVTAALEYPVVEVWREKKSGRNWWELEVIHLLLSRLLDLDFKWKGCESVAVLHKDKATHHKPYE